MTNLEVAKAANKIIHTGITLMTDDMKNDFKSNANPEKFINVAIDEAIKEANTEEEEVLVAAYAVQEANRVAKFLWGEELITEEIEKEYRALPKMKVMADKYNEFVDARNARAKELEDRRKEILEDDKKIDVLKGVVAGLSLEESEKKYNTYRKQIEQAANAKA